MKRIISSIPSSVSGRSRDYARVAAALRRLAAGESANLAEAARDACLSPHHFHRMFRRWAGVSPRKFAAQLALADLKQRMTAGESVLNAAFSAGLSGSARAHDVFVSSDAMTPGDFRRQGENRAVRFGAAQTPYGAAMLAFTDIGVCALRFSPDNGGDLNPSALARDYPQAKMIRDDQSARRIARDIFEDGGENWPLHARGTNFQINVWRALLAIPPGRAASYGALARAIGRPQASRAVGRAAGANPIAYLIPCHRVIGECGALRGYAWGMERKRLMLAREFAANPP